MSDTPIDIRIVRQRLVDTAGDGTTVVLVRVPNALLDEVDKRGLNRPAAMLDALRGHVAALKTPDLELEIDLDDI